MLVERYGNNQEEQRLRRLLERAFRENVPYDSFPEKEALRNFLLERQGNRCAYCERKINDKKRAAKEERPSARRKPTNKIEHFHPQSNSSMSVECENAAGCGDPLKASLELSNLLAVCAGQTEHQGATLKHCDTSKAGADICVSFKNPNVVRVDRPREPATGSLVVVARDGTVTPNPAYFPSEEQQQQAEAVISSTLNLNVGWLKDTRAALYAELTKLLAEIVRVQSKKHPNRGRPQLRAAFLKSKLLQLEKREYEYPSVYFSFCAHYSD